MFIILGLGSTVVELGTESLVLLAEVSAFAAHTALLLWAGFKLLSQL